MEVTVRRAERRDLAAARQLLEDADETGPHAWREKYPGEINFCELLEMGYLTVVAVDEAENVVGFASVNDSPTATEEQRRHIGPLWEQWVDAHYDTAAKGLSGVLRPASTLWFSLFIAQPTYAEAAAKEILKTVAITLTSVTHYLFTVNAEVGLFSPLAGIFSRVPPSAETPAMKLFYCTRTDVLPDLIIRKGLVEDFDDLMPLLQAGVGVLRPPPEEFYLDETLENQGERNSVLVAEDPDTRQIVGLMCMASDSESQAHVTKHYNTEVYHKLRPMQDFDRPGGPLPAGAPNSFQITFLFLDPAYEDRAQCFLRPAFAEFPRVDYGFVCLPHTTTEHPFIQDFSYVPLKTGLTLPNGVWLLCRHSLTPPTVAKLEPKDLKPLENMLASQGEVSSENTSKLMQLTKMAVSSDELAAADAATQQELRDVQCYGLFQHGVVVGYCMLRVLSHEDVHHLRGNFELEDVLCFDPSGSANLDATKLGPDVPADRHALSGAMPAMDVQYFYVRPALRNRIRTFLRDILRQAEAQHVFYCLTPADEAAQPLLAELILARPRTLCEFARPEEAAPQEAADELVCLHYMSKKQLSDEKTRIHARLVVIGASTTGLAAIYHWLSLPYLHIPNIVLVSRDGIPAHPSTETEQWGVDSMTWLEREYMVFRIAGKLRVIEGTMIEFERTERYVITDNGFVEPYDHLIIAAGRQYSIPRDSVTKNLAKNGIFELCDQAQVHKIKQHIRESEAYEDELSSAVVYGSGLDAYATVTALTKVGLAASRIVMAHPKPFPESDVDCVFLDTTIEAKVERLLDALGAKLHRNHVLERTDCDEDHNLAAVYVAEPAKEGDKEERKRKVLEIPATMLVHVDEKDIDTQILSALNKRSIVFDGRVIVRANYRTTDPNIYAIGPIAMFSGRFGPSDEFEMYNPMEVGVRFAETVLGFLGVDEFYEDDDDEVEGAGAIDQGNLLEGGGRDDGPRSHTALEAVIPKELPKYKEKVTTRLQLPNENIYFACHAARYCDVAHKCVHLRSEEATDPSSGQSAYVRLSIGPNRMIECVCYFGKDDVDCRSLATLVGLPESLLNICYEYERSRDESGDPQLNILAYLRSKWASVIYFSTFPRFFTELHERLREHEPTQVLRRKVMEYITSHGVEELDPATRVELMREAAQEGAESRRFIEQETIHFLHKNKQHLPKCYYLPNMRKFITPIC